MSEAARSREYHLPYELTAEQLAKEELERLRDKYGTDARSLGISLEAELPQIIHDAIELGLGLGESFGDISPAELIVAYAAGANENNRGEA